MEANRSQRHRSVWSSHTRGAHRTARLADFGRRAVACPMNAQASRRTPYDGHAARSRIELCGNQLDDRRSSHDRPLHIPRLVLHRPCCRARARSSACATVPDGRPLSSGYRSNHRFRASSELKRLLSSQPPPRNTMVLAGSALTNCPLSNSTRMRVVPSGDESSMVMRSDDSLPLTSDRKSDAQCTQNVRPDASDTR
jgi:hypothetical protein